MVETWGLFLTRSERGVGLLELILLDQVECVVQPIQNVLLLPDPFCSSASAAASAADSCLYL